jgi:hypothetical protein
MFQLRAPYPAISTTLLLPSPLFGDSNALKSHVISLRSMNGTLYTYVRKLGKRKLKWDFEVSRDKALEIQAFMEAFYDIKIQVIDHNDDKWVGYLKNNPFEFVGGGKALPWPGNETMTILIEFEEAS